MSDHAFDKFGDPVIGGRRGFGEPAGSDTSPFLARFGVTLFWGLVIVIVSARILAGV
jgi:hypothetical protein